MQTNYIRMPMFTIEFQLFMIVFTSISHKCFKLKQINKTNSNKIRTEIVSFDGFISEIQIQEISAEMEARTDNSGDRRI